MSYYFNENTADEIYKKAVILLKEKGNRNISSRIGKTTEVLHTVFSISNPKQKFVLSRVPMIILAYSFAELIMLLNGSDDAKIINFWNAKLPIYQGSYDHYPGSYGKRLKYEFDVDQLEKAYETFSQNDISRQVVLEIWSLTLDLPQHFGNPNNEDIPCNICSLLKIRDKKLFWTQIMRSNDVFLGLPYDIFLFTSLQEIMAGWLNVNVGEYMHVSDSLHMYDDINLKLDLHKITFFNEDNLKLNKYDSDMIFKELYIRLQELSNYSDVSRLIKCYINQKTLPESYNNILMILSIYALLKKMRP